MTSHHENEIDTDTDADVDTKTHRDNGETKRKAEGDALLSEPFAEANTGTLDVLYALAALDKPNGSEIARHISGYEPYRSTVQDALKRLREDGYTECGPTPTDRREYWHDLTAKGERAVRADYRWRNGCLFGTQQDEASEQEQENEESGSAN